MPRRPFVIFAAACVVIAVTLLAVGALTLSRRGATGATGAAGQAGAVVSTGQAAIGGPFELVDQNGRTVDQTILQGKWTLVFFGFTYCPDYCPTTLTTLKAVQDQLGDQARDVQIVFVSVDPERDTPQALKTYLELDGYPNGVIGLTGTPEQVKRAADAYRVIYRKSGTGPDYSVNHTTLVYLMGPDGRFRTALQHDLGPQRMTQLVRSAIARG